MRKLIALAAVVALSGCMDDDLSSYRGIPVKIIDSAISVCASANSSLDRIYIHNISTSNQNMDIPQPDGGTAVEYVHAATYSTTARCFSNAKFNQKFTFVTQDSNNISSNETSYQDSY